MRRQFTALTLLSTLLLTAVLLGGCDEQAIEATAVIKEQKMPNTKQSLPVANQQTKAELTQRYNEIKTMIGEATATDVLQCRKVAVGYKACGGPASYLIYSVQGLDEAVLLQKVAAYNALAEAESHRLGLISDCAMVSEPSVTLVGGVCKAGAAGDVF